MHPDDQPPPTRRPSYPSVLETLTSAMFVGLVMGVSGVSTWSEQWWAILIVSVLFTSLLRAYVKRWLAWAISDIRIHIKRDSRG